jgi:uncharacterized RDD family membrane protein YckC
MNISKQLSSVLLPALLCIASGLAWAQNSNQDDVDDDTDQPVRLHHHHGHHGHDNEIVNVGGDSHLGEGQHSDSVVSIFGSATSEGVAGQVVSVFGSTRVTGPVTDDAVAVFGSNYIDSRVDGDAVAVFGDLELGPNAEIGGDAVSVGGHLTRDPGAVVHGEVKNVLTNFGVHFDWLRNWAKHCLMYGRPLAFAPGLGWAWTLALGFLGLYVLLALLFPGGVARCAQTLESQPGQSVLASVLTVLIAPVVIVLLFITVIGIAAVPFLLVGLFCAALFGKTVMLSWLGKRVLSVRQSGSPLHPALAVLIGGAIALLLYLVPIVGFLVYKLLGFLGLGVVILTLLQTIRSRRAVPTADGTATPTGAPSASTASDSAAADAGAAGVATASGEPSTAAGAAATPVPASLGSMPRAGFWIRMVALLLDLILVAIVLSVLHNGGKLEFVVLAAYGAAMWKLRGATIGGIVFDLQVVRQDGRELDWATAIVRALGCFLSMAVAGLGFFWIAFDANKQAWHDKIAGTVVVRTTKRISLV